MNSQSLFVLKNKLVARVFSAFPSLAAAWGRGLSADVSTIPWAVAKVPLTQATVALVSTGGVHRVDQVPFDMMDRNGDPTFREVPVSTPRQLLTITHDYYDHRDADLDLNLVFPAERLAEIAQAGGMKRFHDTTYCLMGHIDGPHLPTLVAVTAPEIARRLLSAHVDYVLLVPA